MWWLTCLTRPSWRCSKSCSHTGRGLGVASSPQRILQRDQVWWGNRGTYRGEFCLEMDRGNVTIDIILDCRTKTAVQKKIYLQMYGVKVDLILSLFVETVHFAVNINKNYDCLIFSISSDKIPENAKEEAGQHWELWDSEGGFCLPSDPRWIYCRIYLLFVRRSPMEGKSESDRGLKHIIHLLIIMKRIIGIWRYIYSEFIYLDLYNPHILFSPVLYIILTCFA